MKKLILSILVLVFASSLLANGLMMPSNENYPKDFLKNTVTIVSVNIHGVVAETTVYQEFLNEWTDTTDVVYSFPLPPDARATMFNYWYKGVKYTAVLKVREQATNPGTGEGGVAALVNKYIGRNGIKIHIKGVAPGQVQKVELLYISNCYYQNGKFQYDFPLETEDFTNYPLDLLQFNINVKSNSNITDYAVTSHSGAEVLNSSSDSLEIRYRKSKAYIASDFKFEYSVENTNYKVDFFSVANDTSAGHYAIYIRSPFTVDADSTLPKRVIFLLTNSTTLYGYKFEQSKIAINNMIHQLTPNDEFNMIIYNYSYQKIFDEPLLATSENVNTAESILNNLNNNSGSDLNGALLEALNEIEDEEFLNMIVLVSDGYTYVDPRQIETLNTYKTGIFPIGIGDNVSRERLEMLASFNYGFVTYMYDDDNISEKMGNMFAQISNPILSNTAIEYGGVTLSDVLPQKIPPTFAGSYFFMTGRYNNPGEHPMSIAGNSSGGETVYDYRINFSDNKDENYFVRYIWAKEKMDFIEREIEVYGETDSLKTELIDLSLAYNIRCRYTAYIADYQTQEPSTDIEMTDPDTYLPTSYILGNYPNPFNPSTKIRFYLDSESVGLVKLIKIYNAIGQLVAVIDVTNMQEGWHEVMFNAYDLNGNKLSSGMYIVQLQVGNNIMSTSKILLLK